MVEQERSVCHSSNGLYSHYVLFSHKLPHQKFVFLCRRSFQQLQLPKCLTQHPIPASGSERKYVCVSLLRNIDFDFISTGEVSDLSILQKLYIFKCHFNVIVNQGV